MEFKAKAPSAANLRMRLACILLGALALLCVLAPQASAVFYRHPFISQFGPDGTDNTKFNKDTFIAIDQPSHDVYVADTGAMRVYRFTGAGAPANFSEGATAGTNRIQIPFPSGYQGDIMGLAIAPAGAAGGTGGDLYVAWRGESIKDHSIHAGGVEIYSPNGGHLGVLDGSGNPHYSPSEQSNLVPAGVAVDPAGNVYVSHANIAGGGAVHIDKYVPNANPISEARFDSEIVNTGGPLLATPGGLYVAGGTVVGTFIRYPYSLFPGGGGSADATGQGTALVLPSGVSTLDNGGSIGVSAVDNVSEDLYLRYADLMHGQYGIYQLDKEANKLSFMSMPAGLGATQPYGVGFDSGSGRVYVANFASFLEPPNKVRIYGPAELLAPPAATVDPPSSVTYKSAQFSGTVNPGGSGEGYETIYRFQCTPSCPELSLNRELSADGADHAVSDGASELQPETKYEVALIAVNGYGNQTVEDTISFETPPKPPLTAPAVTIDAVTSHGAESAHLSGTVDPMGSGEGQDTTYRFEYSSDGVTWVAAKTRGPIEGSGPQAVSEELEGLQPNTTYSVRLHAENGGGEATSEAPNPSFTTDAATPKVQISGATHILATSAQLNARVNPRNSPTTYYFQWGTADCASNPCASLPAGKDADAGSGTDFTFEKAQLNGLSPASTYHYRIVAKNQNGEAASPDATFTTQPAATPCENQRIGASAGLPECRAYEMVSPVQKNGGDIGAIPYRTRAAADGDAVTFVSQAAFAGTHGYPYTGAEYLSSRGADGWSTHSITPFKKAPPQIPAFTSSAYVGEFSPDLDAGVYRAIAPNPDAGPNVEGATNLFLFTGMRSGAPNPRLLSDSVNPLGDQPFDGIPHIALVDASTDLRHVVFEDTDNLLPGASGTANKLYESANGELRLAGILSDSACGAPPCIPSEAVGGAGAQNANYGLGLNTQQAHAVSDDGSRVFFTAGTLQEAPGDIGLEGSLYVRIDGTATVQIDVSERSTPDPKGPGRSEFQWASADGGEVLFFSREELVDEDTDGAALSLYRYEAEAPAGQHLSLIPTDGIGPAHVVNVSEDGSFIYVLATEGIYVLHDGEVRKVAGPPGFPGVGGQGIQFEQAQMTRNGHELLFFSQKNLTDYDTHSFIEAYLYDYDDDELVCASCDPSGAMPNGNVSFELAHDAGLPGPPSTYLHTAIAAGGRRVFFSSPDPLATRDSNGRYDAYVYDVAKGEAQLLSSGQCNCDSWLMTASPSGRDAFFTTRQQLVRIDTDNLSDLYDARLGGGIAAQNALPPGECQGDACQAPPGVPPLASPASAGFSGPASSVAKKAKKHKAKKHRKKRHRNRSSAREANHNRRAGK